MSLYDRLWNGNPRKNKNNEDAPEESGALVRFERFLLDHLLQLIELNLVTVLLCIPVITIPAAFSGMSRVWMLYWRDMPVISMWSEYFTAFRENFLDKLLIWFILFLAPISIPLFFLFMDYREIAIVAMVFVGVISFLIQCYWIPLCSIIALTPSRNCINAGILMAKEWKYSLLLILLVGLPYGLAVFYLRYTFPFWCICIFAVGQLIQCCFTSSAIDKNQLAR